MSSKKLLPKNSPAATGTVGSAVTVILQLLQQYTHLTLPSAPTIAALLTVLGTLAAWLAREEPLITHFLEPIDTAQYQASPSSPTASLSRPTVAPSDGWPTVGAGGQGPLPGGPVAPGGGVGGVGSGAAPVAGPSTNININEAGLPTGWSTS